MSELIYKSRTPPAHVTEALSERERKFLPDSDIEFRSRAQGFATALVADPERWGFPVERAHYIARLAERYSKAHLKAYAKGTRTAITIKRKDQVRAKLEKEIRRAARMIRADDTISTEDKINLFIHERPKTLTKRRCPKRPPYISFDGVRYGRTGREVHVLRFREQLAGHTAKPRGAVRLELFYMWLEMGQKPPKQPDDRARYLRSYTRTPIEVEFPVPPRPMLLVYWGRWADSRGEVGPFSPAVRARPEGWSEEPIVEVEVVRVEPKRLEGAKQRRLAA